MPEVSPDNSSSEPASAELQPPKAPSLDAAEQRKKAEKLLKKQNSSTSKGRLYVAGVAVVAIIAILLGVVLTQGSSSEGDGSTVAGGNVNFPAGASQDSPGWPSNADVVTTPASGTVEVFSDFQCPGCQAFSKTYEDTLQQYAEARNINLVYVPMVFKDAQNGNTSSADATNVFGCAIDAGIGQEYYATVFLNPSPSGWTVKQLKGFAEQLGLKGDTLKTFNSCVDDGKYKRWGSAGNAYATSKGVTSTPTVTVNGVPIDRTQLETETALIQAIEEGLNSGGQTTQ